MQRALIWVVLIIVIIVGRPQVHGLRVKVNREDVIDLKIPPFNNGASPGWNNGSPMIVRKGDDVWFSLSRPVEGALPYVNTKWEIYKRQPSGWKVILQAPGAVEREPAPLALLSPSTLVVYVNPKTTFRAYREENDANLWNSHPHLLAFKTDADVLEPVAIEPRFSPEASFREHTYRGISVNSQTGEILLVNQDPDSELYHPSYRDMAGNWHAPDAFTFPIRSLYANLHVRNGKAHIFAVGDIPEPVAEWREAKYAVLKRHWDYAFRYLNYAWTSNVKHGLLESPLVIENMDDRPSSARNLDLLVEEDGTAHLLYLKRRFQYAFMRDKFFPGEPLSVEIGYARVKEGNLIARHFLVQGLAEADWDSPEAMDPVYGRLHRLENGRMVVVYSYKKQGGEGMRLIVLDKDGGPEEVVDVPLMHPLQSAIFTNTERGGSSPSNRIDLLELGYGDEFHTVRYAEIEVTP